ncbi:hypothetical protein FISHEDRAFT_30923, partial [Fistulina hepatica ATCC 64428]
KKKGHVCPPSNAKHPSDRWESLFIYSFICKFTNLRGKVEGLETPMECAIPSFVNALLSKEPEPILTAVLTRFVLNLRPQARNLSADQISSTVANVIGEHMKTSERTVFWDDERNMNVDPFHDLEGGFFSTDWDFKLKVLRQLVELQLSHSVEVKGIVDRAWGAAQGKNKKKDTSLAPPEPSDPRSHQNLSLVPLGQDIKRMRYWATDDSPRIWASSNPWRITASFQSVSSTREEYVALIERLKAVELKQLKKGEKRPKLETMHLALINALEPRIEAIDVEIARVKKVRKKIEQRQALYAQAELRETRTRRSTQKARYVYNDDESEDGADDEYKFQEDEDYDEPFDDENASEGRFPRNGRSNGRRANGWQVVGQRRSTRTAAANAKRSASPDIWGGFRGGIEPRRSGRHADSVHSDAPPLKRARTESSASGMSRDGTPARLTSNTNGVKLKNTGAAALRPNEIAMEQIAGKKKSKFWVYAVEPVPE